MRTFVAGIVLGIAVLSLLACEPRDPTVRETPVTILDERVGVTDSPDDERAAVVVLRGVVSVPLRLDFHVPLFRDARFGCRL